MEHVETVVYDYLKQATTKFKQVTVFSENICMNSKSAQT